MKGKTEYAFMILLSVIMTLSRFFLVGYSYEDSEWFVNFNLPKEIEMRDVYFITPPLIAISCIALIISTVIAKKTCKPLIIVGISLTTWEAVSFIEFLIYIVNSHGINSVILLYAFTFFATITLLLATYINIKHNGKNSSIDMLVVIVLIIFLKLFINQILYHSEIIDITIMSYYFPLFIMFILFNSYYKKQNFNGSR